MTDYKFLTESDIAAFDRYLIREPLRGALIRYVEHATPPGHFLSAIIRNDLYGAVSRADMTNRKEIAFYVMWLANHAPSACWGHEAAIENWQHVIQQEELSA